MAYVLVDFFFSIMRTAECVVETLLQSCNLCGK